MSDARERSAAVQTYDRNLVIVAGAGTGKTSLLVERVLNQLVEGDLEMRGFAAITFTEKAAAEMRDRLEAGLARLVELARNPAARESVDPKREADRAWRHLKDRVAPDTLRERVERHQRDLVHATISTIHGFCASLLRQFPVEAGVDPDFDVDDGLVFDTLRDEIWQRFLASQHGPESPKHAGLWKRALRGLDGAELRALALALARFDLPAPEGPPRLPSVAQALGDTLLAEIADIDAVLALAEDAPRRGPESWLAAARPALVALQEDDLTGYRRVLSDATFQPASGKERGLFDPSSAPGSAKTPEAAEQAKMTWRLLRRIARVDDALVQDAVDAIFPFVHEVRRAARDRRVLPFDALLALTRDMLAENPKLRARIAERYRVLFVDEFQDTNPLQYEIVFFLAEDAEAGPTADDAFETKLGPGRLFIVGDPKQAIYRFRGADIHAYLQAVEHVIDCGGERLELTTSWRSVPEVLEPLDRLFVELLRSEDPADEYVYSGYKTLESGRDRAGDGPRVEIWTVGDPDTPLLAEAARRAESDVIADWIATEVGAGRQKCSDVALLFRSLKNVRLCARALTERGIPFALEAGRDILERPEGKQVWALLRALAWPGDAPAVLAVLRSPLGGATDEELARHAAAKTGWSYLDSRPDPHACPNVARTFAWLASVRADAARRPLDALLCLIAETLLPLHAAAADGLQRVANLRGVLDPLIELAHADPARSLPDLVAWLERGDALRRHATPDSVDAVRIMSIHAAKGLEFPVVVLPDLGRAPGGQAWAPGAFADVAWLPDLASFAVDLATAGQSSGWVAHAGEEERHARAENGRLLYVGCTRAQERLILVNAPRRSAKNAPVGMLGPWGYPPRGLTGDQTLPGNPADIRTRNVSQPGDARLPEQLPDAGDLRPAVQRARRLAQSARDAAQPVFRSATGLRELAEQALEGEDETLMPAGPPPGVAAIAMEVGSVVHDLLERWDFRDADAARAEFARLVDACAADSADPEALRKRASRVLEALLAGPLPEWLRGREVIARELPLLHRDDAGHACSGTIDLLYLDDDGRMVIADYKTDRNPDAEAEERYRIQLETYAAGIRRAFPDQPEPALELIYVRSGRRVRLPGRTMPA